MSSYHQEKIGKTPTGEDVDEITLINSSGWICKILTLGGIISELHVPNRDGELGDVLLCYDNLDDITREEGWPYFNCIVGRVAGRITAGKFEINSQEIVLEQNDRGNHLHGGKIGLDKKIWKPRTFMGEDGPGVELKLFSPDGDQGYPGNVELSVTYTLSDRGQLELEYQGVSDRKTPLCLTNHAYFNLAGSRSVADHHLTIFTQNKVLCDERNTLLDIVSDISGTEEDFSQGMRLGETLDKSHDLHCGYYIFDEKTSDPRPVARLRDPYSGRVLNVLSTEKGVQLYSACFLEERGRAKGGELGYPAHSAVCLETQGYPNGVNVPEIENILVTPEKPYFQKTIFAFEID